MRKHLRLLILTQHTWSRSRNQKHEKELSQSEVVDSKAEPFFHLATFSRRGPAQVGQEGVLPAPRDMHRPSAIARWRHTCWSSTGHQHDMCAAGPSAHGTGAGQGSQKWIRCRGCVSVSLGTCVLWTLLSGAPLILLSGKPTPEKSCCGLPPALWHFTKP